MYIREIVQQHGIPVKVSCGKSGYPPFAVVKQLSEETFLCRYDADNGKDAKEFTLRDCLDDYHIVEE